MKKKSVRILGVMTGTSCDNLDASCIEISPTGWRPLWSASAPYPKALRETIFRLQRSPESSILATLELNRDLGQWYGATLQRMLRGRKSDLPDLIANHGQTVAHVPGSSGGGMTLQLGDPTRIAQATGITVVSNFREGDMAAGGQGAPLVPMFHRLLAHYLGDPAQGIAIHNLGGVSNLTYLFTRKKRELTLAFDTGPGNMWIDAAAEAATHGKLRMDRDGKLGRAGEIDVDAVDAVLGHPFFDQPAPKSTGRSEFPFEYLTSKTRVKGSSLVATATLVTIESIAQAYERWILGKKLPLQAIFLCGGGAKNPLIVQGLRARLPQIEVRLLSEAGFDEKLVESQAFAFLGFLSVLGKPLGGEWTGASSFGPPGHIIPGENWREVLGKVSTIAGF